jgi:hypothetical protein
VHDAVGGVGVGGGDLRVVDGNALGTDADGEGLALDGLDGLAVRQVHGVHAAGDDVVGEDVVELRLVLRLGEVGDDAGRERGERLVGGGVDGEAARRGELTRPPASASRHVEGSGVAMAMSAMAPAAWADTVGAPPIGDTTHGASLRLLERFSERPGPTMALVPLNSKRREGWTFYSP